MLYRNTRKTVQKHTHITAWWSTPTRHIHEAQKQQADMDGETRPQLVAWYNNSFTAANTREKSVCIYLCYRQMASAHWLSGCWRQVYDETTRDVDLSYNMGVRVSQVKPSNCFRLHPTSNTQQSRFLTACRRLEKLLLPSIFWHKSFVLDDVKVLNERKWRFRGQNILWPLLYIFRGSRPPYPRDLRHPGNKPTQTQTKKHTDTDRQTDRQTLINTRSWGRTWHCRASQFQAVLAV